jgi:hypothetical protein
MNMKQWQKFFKKHPHKDLNGKYIAYDIDGKPLGEIVYKKGVLVSRKKIKRGKHADRNIK